MIAPIVFLCVVFVLVVALAVIYKAVVNQACTCLSDPGGREKAKKEKKKKNEGYDQISPDSTWSSDDEIYAPPTMTQDDADAKVEEGELVGRRTLSPYSACSGYGDTFSLSQSFMSDRGLGRLCFDATYASDESLLKIHVIEGDGLPSKEQGGGNNFKIHLTLLPSKGQRFKSKIQSRYSPNFNETFEFKNIAKNDLFTTAVRFRLHSGSRKMVGETFFQLADIAKLDDPNIKSAWRAFRKIQTAK